MLTPNWGPEDETKPAPMPLRLLQSFVNTWEGDSGVDLLADAVGGRRAGSRKLGCYSVPTSTWFGSGPSARASGPCSSPTAGNRIRSPPTLTSSVGSPDASGCNRSFSTTPRWICGLPTPRACRPWPPPCCSSSATRSGDGSWSRLKACRNPECHWAFYDRSHAGRGAWCDMAVCGNRIKNRNLRTCRVGRERPKELSRGDAIVTSTHTLQGHLQATTGQRITAAAARPSGARTQPQRTAATTTSERYP